MKNGKKVCIPFVKGERIYLRELRISDVNRKYHQWMNDEEVTRFLESRFSPNSTEKLRTYVTDITKNKNYVFFAIVEKNSDRHIGNIKLGPINWIHRFGDIGIMLGDKSSHGKGYGTEAVELVTRFAFETLNLRKVTASCYSNNIGSIRIFQKSGFFEEGRRKEQYFSEGSYVDLVQFGKINPSKTGGGNGWPEKS